MTNLDNKKSVAAVFSGQGYEYIHDLRLIWSVPNVAPSKDPFMAEGEVVPKVDVRKVITEAGLLLQAEVAAYEAQFQGGVERMWKYKYGMAVHEWLESESSEGGEKSMPESWYLDSAPVSMPLIFLTQMANYIHSQNDPRFSFDPSVLECATGHSQGVVAAVALSLAKGDPESLVAHIKDHLILMFWLGLRLHQILNFKIAKSFATDSFASPMLAIDGLNVEQVRKLIKESLELARHAEESLQDQEQRKQVRHRRQGQAVPEASARQVGASRQEPAIDISIINGPEAFVVSGLPRVLTILKQRIEQTCLSVDDTEDQSRVPYPKRKAVVKASFLRVSVPFHSSLAKAVVQQVVSDLQTRQCTTLLELTPQSLAFSVLDTCNATDLRKLDTATVSLVQHVIALQAVSQMNFQEIVASLQTTHILEYGPVGQASIGATARMIGGMVEGRGQQVMAVRPQREPYKPPVNLSEESEDKEPETETDIIAVKTDSLLYRIPTQHVLYPEGPTNWAKEYAPRMVRRKKDGKRMLWTRFSQLTGRPPLIMSGMTPTTSFYGIDLVAAATNEGFHGELAAGGLPIPSLFVEKLDELVSKLEPGRGIAINMLYLNAYQWGFQFPLVKELSAQGYPFESITIGAGVPSMDKAIDIISDLRECGMTYMSFKPGNVNAMEQVLEIAEAHPNFTFVLQWTGGRGGGHHSSEDFHKPLLKMYGAIRKQPNVVLLVGSGFGDAKGSVAYLDGSWSQRLGYPCMPCDGILMGSRWMVAKEAATWPSVKQMIVDAYGAEDEDKWTASYDGGVGGVISVMSELGEPIHKLVNRGMRCWDEFDRKYFSLPRGSKEREQAILRDREAIIHRLNNDFQKPYFGRKEDGSVAEMEQLTYAETLRRMVELMYVYNGGDEEGRLEPNRWIDIGYQRRTFEFMLRTEQRFIDEKKGEMIASNMAILDEDPMAVVNRFVDSYPEVRRTLLSDEDVAFFIHLCANLAKGKPVNFVPVVDKELEFWYKKDSLWFSEQVDAVPGRDAQKVAVLHGPVAAKYSTKANEPVADIFRSIHDEYISLLKVTTVEEVESLVFPSQQYALPAADTDDATRPRGLWADLHKALKQSEWLSSAFSCPRVMNGDKWSSNRIPDVFRPREGYKFSQPDPNCFQMVDEAGKVQAQLCLVPKASESWIELLFNDLDTSLNITFVYRPEHEFSCLHEPKDQGMQHGQSIRQYYKAIWLDDSSSSAQGFDPYATFDYVTKVSMDDVKKFNAAIGRVDDFHSRRLLSEVPSMDFATILSWKALMKALFVDGLEGNLLSLVHRSHRYKLISQNVEGLPTCGIAIGDEMKIKGHISAIKITDPGKEVTAVAQLYRLVDQAPVPWMTVESTFLIRGLFEYKDLNFERYTETIEIALDDAATKFILERQSWLDIQQPLALGDRLSLSLNIMEQRKSKNAFSHINVEGSVFRKATAESMIKNKAGSLEQIGTISFLHSDKSAPLAQNTVLATLQSLKDSTTTGTIFENSGYTLLEEPALVTAPTDCMDYAQASGDMNPIHRNEMIATYANLPNGSPIVHGMWTACMARGILEDHMSNLNRHSIHDYSVEFLDMVFPGDELVTQLIHTGLRNGRWLVRVEVRKVKGGSVVLQGRAEVDQAPTAFFFTGQGSAVAGMGMDLYETSEVSRKVWDRADIFFKKTYGFSILDIVRNNPKHLEIHFGGPLGKRIRDNYLAMRAKDPATGNDRQLIAEIRPDTKSFSFQSPEGLLFATQFSQPALVLVQKAAFEELRSKGIIPEGDLLFAGHSLGEYAAIASVADVLTIEDLVATVFLRGMVMQNAVVRDAEGRSNYAMVAANPMRIHKGFSHEMLEYIVNKIEEESNGKLIQIVNYNVRNLQYVVSGELVTLEALCYVLNNIKARITKAKTVNEQTLKELQDDLPGIIAEGLSAAERKAVVAKKFGRPFQLERGVATIPLPGIDVPFHSKQLLDGVDAFRSLLAPKITIPRVLKALPHLLQRYIPNVVAEPFSVEKTFIRHVAEVTGSKNLNMILEGDRLSTLHDAQKARILLIELLAHQFAMPVRWIDTQDVVFMARTQRVIEMGPAPTLVTMAKNSLKVNVYSVDEDDEYVPEILWWGNNRADIFYELEDCGPSAADYISNLQVATSEEESEVTGGEESEPPAPEPAATPAAAPVAPAPVAAPAAAAPSSASADFVPNAGLVVRVMLAQKLQLEYTSIKSSDTPKALSKGRSAILNELVGDLGAEFGANALPEGVGELPLEQTSTKLQDVYKGPGKHINGQVTKMVSAKLAGGFNLQAVKAYLRDRKGLKDGTVESVLIYGLTAQPKKRHGSADESQQWLDGIVNDFGNNVEGAKAAVSGGGGASGGASMAMMPAMAMASAGPALQPVDDVPIDVTHAMRCLIAAKLKKEGGLREVGEQTTLKQLTGGRSAIQNELVGDLAQEFGDASADGIADLPLTDVGSRLAKAGPYSDLGKVSSGLVTKMLSAKLPGGFNSVQAVRAYLSETRLLGPLRQTAVLLHALAMPPAKRFGSAEEAKGWIDTVVDDYASTIASISIPHAAKAGSGGAGGAMMGGAMAMSPEALKQMMGPQRDALKSLVGASLEACQAYLEKEHGAPRNVKIHEQLMQAMTDNRALEDKLAELTAELGDEFCDGIQPQHQAAKSRTYDSYWNWVIQDALQLYHHVLAKIEGTDANRTMDTVKLNYYENMANFITSSVEDIRSSTPPREWFRNFMSNRATEPFVKAVEYFAVMNEELGLTEYAQAIALLAEQSKQWIDKAPIYNGATIVTDAPEVTVKEGSGAIDYREVPRTDVSNAEQYVQEMSRGVQYDRSSLQPVANPSQTVVVHGRDKPFNVEGTAEEDSEEARFRNSPLLAAMESDDASTFSSYGMYEDAESGARGAKGLPAGQKLEAMRMSLKPTQGTTSMITGIPEDATVPTQKPAITTSVSVPTEIPHVHLKKVSDFDSLVRIYAEDLTSKYLSCLHDIAVSGVSFAGQVALVTGAGNGSIGIEIVKALLEGGATVIVGYRGSRPTAQLEKIFELYREIYQEFGSKGSKLHLETYNGSSAQDTEALVQRIYSDYGYDLDFIIPFAAAPENGRDISSIDGRSELSHRMMLTNVVRLLGAVKATKQEHGIETRPAMVLLPCSPNHGVFGFDGLYAESKLGLESLVHKWESEGWQNYLSLATAVIGWTRSRLMYQNNIVSPGVEAMGCRTFHTTEMAYNLVGLLHPYMATMAAEEPLWADLTGNWHVISDIKAKTNAIREDLQQQSRLQKALHQSAKTSAGPAAAAPAARPTAAKLSNPLRMYTAFPKMPETPAEKARFSNMQCNLQNAVDLRQVVVVTGFGEVGPYGGSHTRWEMEAYGEFSLEGCIQLAWLIGLIKPNRGPLKSNPRQQYFGWVDATTMEPVADHEIKAIYEQTLLERCGIRVVEPELFEGYRPEAKSMLHAVALDRDAVPVEVADEATARDVQRESGGPDACDVFQAPNDGPWYVRLRKGAVMHIPRALNFRRFVAGQVPTGWDAKLLGVPADIADSVDPVTLYALVATVDALVCSGVSDPYEFYAYVHLSEVGNASGSGMGGQRQLKRMFIERKVESELPSDTMAESFINTMPAWINMLLLSSCGPVKTPVGACATAAESVEIACDTILSGKARVMLAGGYDDFSEASSYEFGVMGATNDSTEDAKKGRLVHEASRPFTDSRAGFLESHGSGVQVLMDAELALDMGVPIYGILGHTATATDREGRSIPAPGKGILSTAREHLVDGTSADSTSANPLMDLRFRRDNLTAELESITAWEETQLRKLGAAAGSLAVPGPGSTSMSSSLGDESDGVAVVGSPSSSGSAGQSARAHSSKAAYVRQMAHRKRQAAYDTWGQGFYRNDTSIAPLRGALAVWGLTVDDLTVASFHGTSTKLNDQNESSVIQRQMEHLGRSEGNPMYAIAQKYLTGHPKGAACAWMLNGLLQCLNDGIIPGNRNLDNVSPELSAFTHLFYPNKSMQVPFIKAALLKSFGFGQAGAEILLVHPQYLLATLTKERFDAYLSLRNGRENAVYRYQQGVYSAKHTLVQVKSHAPYGDADMERIFLDPLARAQYSSAKGTWMFPAVDSEDALLLEAVKSSDAAKDEVRPSPRTELLKGKTSQSQESQQSQQSRSTTKPRTTATSPHQRLAATVQERAEGLYKEPATKDAGTDRGNRGVGIDVEKIATFEPIEQKGNMIHRNFTPAEQEYCNSAAHPAASYAGRWAAKEAVLKALTSAMSTTANRKVWNSAEAPLLDFEIVPSVSGAPTVQLHGYALDVFNTSGFASIKVSISYSDDIAIAQALVE
eukprot:Clim_evm12s162 gene=Clim_evmTU12s162